MSRPYGRRGKFPAPRRADQVLPCLRGETVFVVGSGPSLKGFDFERLRGRPVIAVNNAYQYMPWAPFLFYGDTPWWREHKSKVIAETSGQIFTTALDRVSTAHLRTHWLELDHSAILCTDPRRIAGKDSGTKATNLAFHFGAALVVHLGIDMRFGPNGESHHHAPHKRLTQPKEARYTTVFTPRLQNMVQALELKGCGVVRATDPGPSFIELVDLDTLLRRG